MFKDFLGVWGFGVWGIGSRILRSRTLLGLIKPSLVLVGSFNSGGGGTLCGG